MSDLELRNYFEFDEGDLATNRAGRLSEKQNLKIAEAESGANQIFFWAGVVFILIALAFSYGLFKPVVEAGWTTARMSDLVGSAIGFVVVWGILGFLAIGSFRLSKSKMDSSVQKVEGKVNFVKVEKRVTNTSSNGPKYRTEEQYELRVGRIAFENVEEELLNTIEEGDTYAFYYTKDTKDILSCEFISKGK
jgi:hypothetical protein